MYGIKDNMYWIAMDEYSLTENSRQALKFDSFQKAWQWMRDLNLECFCVVRLDQK